jgi:biotin carboxyl carrier protein
MAAMRYVTTVGDRTFEIEIEEPGVVQVDDHRHAVDLQEIVPGRLYSLLLDQASSEAFVEGDGNGCCRVLLRGDLYRVKVEDERSLRLARGLAGFVPASGEIPIRAPMPGLVMSIPVEVGQPVRKGEVLVILESMKMDNELCAPRDGVIARVHVDKGASVDARATLVTLA